MVKSLICWFGIILLGSSVLGEVPSYIHICGRRNPKLNECIIKSTEALRSKLMKGIPELDVPPMEPLFLRGGLPAADSQDLKAYAKNVKIWHTLNYTIKGFNIDLDKKFFTYSVHFDKMRVEGDYEITAKIIVPIKGAGSIVFQPDGIDANMTLHYKLVNTKRGKYMYFTSMTTQLKIGDYKAKFKPNDATSVTLSDAINYVINSNRQELIHSLLPALEKTISARILHISNRICKNFTYNELFPDRE